MSEVTVMSATMMCTFGLAPGVLAVLPLNRTTCGGMVAANIEDSKPLVNITTFGMCCSLANPVVAAATTAALGVLTPMPCIPATAAPWVPGSPTVLLGGLPILNNTSICLCSYGGEISIIYPGQVTTTVA